MQTREKTPETRDRRSGAARRALVGGLVAAVLLAPAASFAQSDVTPPLPNVLILLDTSGSMERFPNGKLPTVAKGMTSTEKTRWVQALEVLGGSIDNYALLNQPRTGTDFVNEYGLGGQSPYDLDYFLPHYRALSNNCAIGSNSLSTTKTWPTDWKSWGTSDFGFRSWNGASLGTVTSCSPTDFKTDGLGILDTFRDQARFGLMTFDTTQDPKSGWNGTTHDPVAGMVGTWSYFPGWDGKTASTPTYGWPAGCSLVDSPLSNHLQELGARNPSAPPWEGPMVPFAVDDSTSALRGVNDRIRYAMLAARPYGPTPIAPMLADAQYYLWNDPAGPQIDPLSTCRGNFIILITDGFPTSDLRPNCQDNPDPKAASVYPGCDKTTGGGGCCPTKRAQDIAYDLAHPPSGKPAIKTFVVGFGLSDETGAPIDCSIVDPASGACSSSTLDPKYKPCCTLHEIAYNGDPPSTDTTKAPARALLANDVDTLRKALLSAMAEATKSTSTSRTLPVFTMATSGTTTGGQYEFRSSFKVNAFSSWSGVLERVRWECRTTSGALRAEPVLPISSAAGDDFAVNLNKQASRTFFTWDASTAGANVKSGDTLRPNLATADSDGINPAVPTVVTGENATFVTAVPSSALQLSTASCTDAASVDECKAKFLNYALAQPQPKPTWQSRVGNALGDIYHATPVHVGPPSGFLRDESYTQFRNSMVGRPPVMLTATNDGILHAFDARVASDSEPVELWGFIPPAVLPHIAKQYGGAHALLLDAAPVVKDVAFGQPTSTTPYGRTRNDARGGTAFWRTVAVGALTTGRGYYALDVTDMKAPKLLWQITKFKDGTSATAPEYDIFGTYPGTPAIGTIYYSESSTGTPIETPVAFLPGGEGTPLTGLCNRWTTPVDGVTRKQVRCWTGPGNSFTIVRLLDGKVIRSFRNDPVGDGTHVAEPNSATARWAGSKNSIVTDASGKFAGIDSPITGTVALYPAAEGSVTSRAFVGDYDGTLWKLDVSDPNPQKWTFDIFHDAYHTGDSANAVSSKWGPIAIAPVLTVDRFGDIVVNYATGDQNNFSTSNLNHVYSITERTTVSSSGKTLVPTLNWHLKFTGGITPTGPMSLFSGNLFFSTFTPDVTSADACLRGQGTLWGVDYLETEPSIVNDDGTPVPMGRHTKSATATTDESAGLCPPAYKNADARTGYPFFRCIQLPPGSIVFGAGITQRPSCVQTPSSAIGIDPYMGGASSHMTISDISVGEFQLVAQTGPKSGTTSGSGSTTNTYVRSLVPPLSSTRIDSWAAIIE